MDKKDDITLLLLTNPEFVKWIKEPNEELDIYWNNWMQAHPGKVVEVKKAREIVLGLNTQPHSVSKEGKSRVLQNILAHEQANEIDIQVNQNPHSWLSIKQWYKVAVILILTSFTGYLLSQLEPKERQEVEASVKKPVMLTKTTHFGEKLNFKLPDGSGVWLNSGSQLIFPVTFDSLERKVFLSGEGYFEVKKDSSSVFKVVSGNIETIALGTSFNINFFDPNEVFVSLLTGKVEIQSESANNSYLLDPGEQLQYRQAENHFNISEFSDTAAIGWKEGLLVFENAAFDKVVAVLERWYGVEIQVTGKPQKPWALSGKYFNQTLDLVLNRMSFIENFKYEINGKKIHLKF
ncbi:FecR domain-containing protein [uncultured Cyclobacterium sp.]|uniref:FecR family protein n=1 Tax=uncultured Cyclobacterium sp. TaxID=453820 RepID=UPI0030ECCA19